MLLLFPVFSDYMLLLLYVIIMSNLILMYICYTCSLYSTELQKELQSLQEIITSLTLQLREKEERNVHLTDNIKGILMTCTAFILSVIDLRSQILEVLKTTHPIVS